VAQGVEGKVSDVDISQQEVVVILESFLLKVVAELVGHYKAVVKVLVPCPLLILCLQILPAGKFVNHCAGQRNDTAGILGLGCTKYNLGFALACMGLIFGKAVDGAPDMKLRRREINVLPL